MTHDPVQEQKTNPCANCPTPHKIAGMGKYIAVGFGRAEVLKDGECVLDGEKLWEDENNPPTFATAEELASADPAHNWTVVLHGPMHGETYQRQGPEHWVLIEQNQGFA